MNVNELYLLPADLHVEPHPAELRSPPPMGSYEHLAPTEETMSSIVGHFEEHWLADEKDNPISTMLFGRLRIRCLITDAEYLTPIIATEGLTAHALNNNSLIQALGTNAEMLVINVKELHSLPSSKGDRVTFIERGRQYTFAIGYSEVSLVPVNGLQPIHVFWRGMDKVAQELIDAV